MTPLSREILNTHHMLLASTIFPNNVNHFTIVYVVLTRKMW